VQDDKTDFGLMQECCSHLARTFRCSVCLRKAFRVVELACTPIVAYLSNNLGNFQACRTDTLLEEQSSGVAGLIDKHRIGDHAL